jgi:transposase
MAQGDLTDHEWAVIGPLLPPEHERYGKWNSVYVRFRRWAEQGGWDALLQALVELRLTDDWQHMLDSTVVRTHS